jgi:putative methionine-R-sulfoxide reductase with GAF domain
MPLQNYSLPDTRTDQTASLTERQLLFSVVEIARNVFGAAASSIFLIDDDTGELVFEAVAGEGDGHLPGTRLPAGTGIAGWVATSGQPMYVDDLSGSTRFARDAAASTGYVPDKLMAAPLIRGEDCIGVLEVLDASQTSRSELTDLDLLGLLAIQAAISLEIFIRAHRRPTVPRQAGPYPAGDDPYVLVDRIGNGLSTADPAAVTLATTLLKAAADVVAGGRPNA